MILVVTSKYNQSRNFKIWMKSHDHAITHHVHFSVEKHHAACGGLKIIIDRKRQIAWISIMILTVDNFSIVKRKSKSSLARADKQMLFHLFIIFDKKVVAIMTLLRVSMMKNTSTFSKFFDCGSKT